MPDNTDINYNVFVRALAKPGQDIIKSLTPEKAHLWHMAGEVRGEFLELQIANANSDGKNFLEEAGDMLFYLQGTYQFIPNMAHGSFEGNALAAWESVDTYNEFLKRCQEAKQPTTLLIEVERLTTMAKRIVIYEKDIEPDKLHDPIQAVLAHLANALRAYGYTLADAFEHNRKKLMERYETLSYSNDQANQRRDEKGDDE